MTNHDVRPANDDPPTATHEAAAEAAGEPPAKEPSKLRRATAWIVTEMARSIHGV